MSIQNEDGFVKGGMPVNSVNLVSINAKKILKIRKNEKNSHPVFLSRISIYERDQYSLIERMV